MKNLELLPITSRYLGVLGCYYLFITFRVIKERIKLKEPREVSVALIKDLIIKLKNGEEIQNNTSVDPNKFDKLSKEIRAHGNFSEYVPLVGVLSIINELNNVNSNVLHASLLLLLFGRMCHHFGMIQKRGINGFRSTGIVSTFLSILISSVSCLYHLK